MRYFLDTELNDDGRVIDLISIGIVADDDREFYAISKEFDRSLPNPWVIENVIPKLDPPESSVWKNRGEIRDELAAFVGDDVPQFWAYTGAYDWVALAQLFGPLTEIPRSWPLFIRDLRQWAEQLGNPKLPVEPAEQHHALVDARHNKKVYEFLAAYEASSRSKAR
jgi:3'-5' exoribonuclease-like protein